MWEKEFDICKPEIEIISKKIITVTQKHTALPF